MSGIITKEELDAFTKANVAVALELSKIADTSKDTSETLEKIATRLYNGMPKEIAAEITKEFTTNCVPCQVLMKSVKDDTSVNRTNIDKVKLFVGGTALAIVIVTSIVTIVLRAVDTRALAKAQTKEMLIELRDSGVIK